MTAFGRFLDRPLSSLAEEAVRLALSYAAAGEVEVELAVGAEKMVSVDSALSMAAFEGSWDRAKKAATLERLAILGKQMPTPPEEAVRESPHTVFMDIYSAFAKYHMARFGTT